MARYGISAFRLSLSFTALCAFLVCAPVGAQARRSGLDFRFGAEYSVPLFGDESVFDPGYSAALSAEYSLASYFSPLARAAFSSLSLRNLTPISAYEGALGFSSRADFRERLFARLELSGGLFSASWEERQASGIVANARGELGLRLSPAFRISAVGGLSRFFQRDGELYTGVSAGLSLSLFPEELDRDASRLRVESADMSAVFPVFYSYYNEHPFGAVEIRNGEDILIRDVRVSFFAPEYMSGPTECAVFETLEKGQLARVPITALFNEKIMSLTERTKTRGRIIVSYRKLGSKREYSREVDLSVQHRNAMTWSDDRRAAAFVSAKDPAVLWFSRFVNAVVRDRFRPGIDRNMQQAVGIFEAMKLFGLAYVVDPSSAYVDSTGKEDVVDYLQYPYQTLFYRGGDCDDLSILYTSLLQSVGIETAFITIPGHIYMAFATELSEAEARRDFYDPELLIFKDGKAWIPVEITMVKDGFVKAWRVGAKEWLDNARKDKANFYRMSSNWSLYPAVGVSDVNPRFQLPEEAETMKAFDLALDRHVAREIEPRVRGLKGRLALAPMPETENEIGLTYARFGMLNEAWSYFSSAAQKGFMPAWTNLANIAFIRKDYPLALKYYRYASEQSDYEPAAFLGAARSEYELEHFDLAESDYEKVRLMSPALADKYGYLVSMFGGTGRAWSFAERAASVEWLLKPSERPESARVSAVPMPESKPAAQPTAAAVAPAAAAAAAPVAPAAPVVVAEPAPKAEVPGPNAVESAEPPALSLVEPAPETVPVEESEPAVVETAEETTEESAAEPASLAEAPKDVVVSPAAVAVGDVSAPPPAEANSSASKEETPTPVVAAVEPEPADAHIATPEPPFAASPPALRKEDVAPPVIAAAAPIDADIQERAAAAADTLAPEPPAAAVVAVFPDPLAAQTPPVRREAVAPPIIAAAAPIDADIQESAAADAAIEPAESAAEVAIAEVAEPASVAPTPATEEESVSTAAAAEEPEKPAAEEERSVVAIDARAEESPAAVAAAAIPVPSAERTPIVENKPEPHPIVAEEAAVESEAAPQPEQIPPVIASAKPAESISPASNELAPPSDLESNEPDMASSARVPSDPENDYPEAEDEIVPAEPHLEAIATVAAAKPTEVPLAVEKAAIEAPISAPNPASKAMDETPVAHPLSNGFSGFKVGGGDWQITEAKAVQNDPKQMFAKIIAKLPETATRLSVGFNARATGYAWTGFGVHVRASDVVKFRGYGAGSSLLVWFTRDARNYPDSPERVQLYRSVDDINMRLIADEPLPISIGNPHSYRIESDSDSRSLLVYVDEVERLSVNGYEGDIDGSLVIFRALDMVEFTDFKAEAMP